MKIKLTIISLFLEFRILNNEDYIPTNTSNGFKGSEFLINNILENGSSSIWVTYKKKMEIIYMENMKTVTTEEET